MAENHDPNAESDEEEDENDKPPRMLIAGPAHKTYPAPEGWTPAQQTEGEPIKGLYDLTVKKITRHLTTLYIGSERPSCEAAWQKRFPGPPIPWKKIWASLGTPFSDAWEEKHWRKLLHRAIFTHNRDRSAVTDKCRLGCGSIESQIHLLQCSYTSSYWDAVFQLIHQLGGGTPTDRLQSSSTDGPPKT